MQQKQLLEYTAPSLKRERNKGLAPSTVISLLGQLNRSLTSWMLTTTFQKLEIVECENDRSSQHIILGIKIGGWVDPQHLKHRMHTLAQMCSKHLSLAGSREQEECFPVVPHWFFVDLKEFSASEQLERIQYYTSGYILRRLALEASTQLHICIFRLHSEIHMFYMIMRQNISMASSSLFLYELLNVLHTRKTTSAFCSSPGMSEYKTRVNEAQSLTSRELEILRYISSGLSNREIAQRCCIAEGTVKRHVNNIYVKLNVGSRTQAVALAQSLDLLV
ncbi:MAG TPA: helix-turn-helix transcriptional regulator [Ktedonobacteraceae bacterium]|nr:helix-turn-helix transcriptional regulator [Ktedonobacteraceae bacterium]